MIRFFLSFFFFVLAFSFKLQAQELESSPFKISWDSPLKNIDPHRQRTSSGAWVSQQIYRNFYIFDDKQGFVPELGEKCEKLVRRWKCDLKKGLKWSDGSTLTAEDFVLSFRRMLTLPHPRADLLFNIENAEDVFTQKKRPTQLGIRATGPYSFEIRWTHDSLDNEVVLMSPLFVPLPSGLYKEDVFSGPYLLADRNNQRTVLLPNRQYFKKNNRPVIELQIFEENLAVKAFEAKQLDLLKRVPTAQIPKNKKSKEFYWQPVMRFDSVVFGPSLASSFNLRKQIAEGLDYGQWQKLFDSPEKVGCPGLPATLYGDKQELCYKGNQKATLSKKDLEQKWTFAYSTSGGDDFRRQGEWLQSQLLSKLKIQLQLQPLENKIFQDTIEKSPPPLFRRGLNLESPSCHMALKTFTSTSPDNFTQFKNSQFDGILTELDAATNPAIRSRLCTQALRVLMDSYMLIPTGRIHFALMVSQNWQGWKTNSLFHLDLSELKARSK